MPGFEWFGDEERKEVNDVLESGVLMRYGFDGARNGHWKARELEQQLAAKLGAKYAHVCSSGTAAVYAALVCAGIGAGDEVIVPPFTFVADIEAVLYAGAVPVFAEIDESLTLDPESVRSKITPRTKAVLLVHMCGAMAQVDVLQHLCCEHGLLLVEDVAQALGASYNGRPLGSFGIAGCYSFDYVKTITAGEGGGVVTADAALYDRLQAFTDHGHDHAGVDRGADLHPIMGLNFRISELHAAVGIAQLRKLDAIIAQQRHLKSTIKSALAGIDGLSFRHLPDPDGDSATFLSFFLPDADKAAAAVKALGAAGVDGCFYWYGNNWHYHRKWDHFKQFASANRLHIQNMIPVPEFTHPDLPKSDAIMSRCISMLIKLSWSPEQALTRAQNMRTAIQSVL